MGVHRIFYLSRTFLVLHRKFCLLLIAVFILVPAAKSNDQTYSFLLPTPGKYILAPQDLSLQVGQCIGAGAFAYVYQARDTKSSRSWALRLFKSSTNDDTSNLSLENYSSALGQSMRSIDRHMKVQALPKVKYLARPHYAGPLQYEDKTLLGIVLPLGQSDAAEYFNKLLSSTLGSGLENHLILLAENILHGILELSQNNLIHNDIKLKNILYTTDGLFVLSDFDSLTEVGEHTPPMSTLTFASPEILSNRFNPKNTKSYNGLATDLYSFAATLAYALFPGSMNPPIDYNAKPSADEIMAAIFNRHHKTRVYWSEVFSQLPMDSTARQNLLVLRLITEAGLEPQAKRRRRALQKALDQDTSADPSAGIPPRFRSLFTDLINEFDRQEEVLAQMATCDSALTPAQ